MQKRLAPGQLRSCKRRRVAPDDLPHSHLASSLMEMIGRGPAHVSKACHLARAAVCDSVAGKGAVQPLAALASCGCDGKFESNAERDYLRWTKGLAGLHLEPYVFRLTLQVSQTYTLLVCRFAVSGSKLVHPFVLSIQRGGLSRGASRCACGCIASTRSTAWNP